MNKPYGGIFITIEGGDGCGKSTLANGLAEKLKGLGCDVLFVREPGGTALSEKVRQLVLSPDPNVKIGEKSELLLFLTARAQHIEEVILPALRHGKVVICDRFNDSSIVYQGCARDLGASFVEKICHLVTEDVEPDFTLLLDIKPEVGLARLQGTNDRIEQEKLQFHQEVRQGYLHLADTHCDRITVIDADQPPEKVLQDSIDALESKCLTPKNS